MLPAVACERRTTERDERERDPDRELVQACLRGPDGARDEAFRVLHDRHRARVQRIAARITGNPSDALDSAQDAFLTAFREIHAFRGESSFASWLYRIATRTSIDHLRRKQVQRSFSNGEDLDLHLGAARDPVESAERREQRTHVRLALRRLTHERRQVLFLRHFEGLSYGEIGARLAIAMGSVRSRLHRAHADPIWGTSLRIETPGLSAELV